MTRSMIVSIHILIFIFLAISNSADSAAETMLEGNVTTRKPASWYTEALQEIAYYLRAHKFNEFDRRYEANVESPTKEFFRYFPKPPLRALHWEVSKFCEPSFETCVDYIKKRIRLTGIRRHDDTSEVMTEHNWNFMENADQINQVDKECRKAQSIDDRNAYPYEGPIERFQWRTTASYFMCSYTMKGEQELEHLSRGCDNFSNCLDRKLGARHHDPRANDAVSFSCAMYSFCPDPCCAQRHLARLDMCWESTDNPCYQENPPGARQCSVNRSENHDIRNMILNKWNVTCNCLEGGFRWNSLYGMCVDVDECTSTATNHNCDPKIESCVNLKGSYRCACKWGYGWNHKLKKCSPSPALALMKLHRNHSSNISETNKSLLWKLLRVFNKNGSRSATNVTMLSFVFVIVSGKCFLFYLSHTRI